MSRMGTYHPENGDWSLVRASQLKRIDLGPEVSSMATIRFGFLLDDHN